MQQKYFKHWVLPAFLAVLASLFSIWPPTLSAQNTGMSLALCRSNVSPCQDAISLGVGDSVTLDLVLLSGSLPLADDPVGLLAWETHLVLSGDTGSIGMPADPPVQAPDDPALSFAELSDYGGIALSGTRHFPVQNLFDPARGLLDYSVVLIGPDSPSEWSGLPFSTQTAGTTLGSVQVGGVRSGAVAVSGSRLPSQVVIQEPGGAKVPVRLSLQYPLAALSVGSEATPSIAGRISGLPTADSGLPLRDRTMLLSLWEVGAVPPWRGGADGPRITFHGVELGSDGAFAVSDIPPSLAPPGPYAVRLKVGGALTRSVSGTVPPRESGSSQIVLADIPSPLFGDSNGDDRVNSVDVDLLKDAFGSAEESPNVTDFNLDGITDVADFSVMALHYGEVGE